MSQPLRIESPKYASLGTSRTVNSALWFVNNKHCQERILGYLGKYQEEYEVTLYAFVFSGSHDHALAHFPNMNRASFYRDLNARTAEAVRYTVSNFLGGPLFERRYSEQAIPREEDDIEDYFFYCALQPIAEGLCEKLSDYPGYNSFHDAICEKERKFKVINWARYNARKRSNPDIHIKDFTKWYRLKYQRLPGYENLTKKEYRELMLSKLEQKRQKLVQKRKSEGKGFLTKEQLRAVVPGTLAKNPQKSRRYDPRPLVLTKFREFKREFLEWYFSIYDWYKRAVREYLSGKTDVEFPPGTYKPPGPLVGCPP